MAATDGLVIKVVNIVAYVSFPLRLSPFADADLGL
jgi:hypothetical protein